MKNLLAAPLAASLASSAVLAVKQNAYYSTSFWFASGALFLFVFFVCCVIFWGTYVLVVKNGGVFRKDEEN